MPDLSPPPPMPSSSESDESSPYQGVFALLQVQWGQEDLRMAQHDDDDERWFRELANHYAFTRPDLRTLATAIADGYRP